MYTYYYSSKKTINWKPSCTVINFNCCKKKKKCLLILVPFLYIYVRTRFVTTQNDIGFTRKNAQTISLIERGFERLSIGHRTRVSRLIRTELGRVRSRSLSL